MGSGTVISVNSTSVRALEQPLYQDVNFIDKIKGAWSFFRLKEIRVRYVPRYKFPPNSSDNGFVCVLGLSSGKDYSNQSALGINAPVDTTVELPSSRVFHTFTGTSINHRIVDTKWYPVESDEINPHDRRQYDLWLLFNHITGTAATTQFGVIIYEYVIEVKGLLI